MENIRSKITTPRNPLAVIALFVLFTEGLSTTTLGLLLEYASPYSCIIVIFIVVYTFVITLLFFFALWKFPQAFYGPGDFKNEEFFFKLMSKVELIDARQRVEALDEKADTQEVIRAVETIVKGGDVYAAMKIGRVCLSDKKYELAKEIFSRLLNVATEENHVLSRSYANLAYAKIGLQDYASAINDLNKLKGLRGEFGFHAWHKIAYAYCLWKLGKENEVQALLSELTNDTSFLNYRSDLLQYYPDFGEVVDKYAKR